MSLRIRNRKYFSDNDFRNRVRDKTQLLQTIEGICENFRCSCPSRPRKEITGYCEDKKKSIKYGENEFCALRKFEKAFLKFVQTVESNRETWVNREEGNKVKKWGKINIPCRILQDGYIQYVSKSCVLA